LSSVTLSWALSLNAITGVIATRRTASAGRAGFWLLGTAAAALAVGTLSSAWVFFAAMALWGFAFWMGVPAIFKLLAERSKTPSERVGDAQAAMAVGRVFGPVMGGLALGVGQFGRLSLVGAAVMTSAALLVTVVEGYRRRSIPLRVD
jgi:DHA1 family inner membrane transport protein